MPNATHGIPVRRIITQTVTDNTVQKDIAHGPCTLLSVRYTNAQTTAAVIDHYIHLFDDLNPSLGPAGTAQDVKLLCRDNDDENGKSGFLINPNNGGLVFSNGLSFGVSTDTDGDNTTAMNESSTIDFVVLIAA